MMNEKEAIKIINNMPNCFPWEVEALYMAIKALEQQSCEDCISKEAVIEWLKDKDIIKTKNQEENARRELTYLTSVTPSYSGVKTELKPSENCINRDDAIELIAGADETNGNEPVFSGKQVIKMLKGLPSVTPKTRWIPVSERLPEEETDVLICNENGDIEITSGSYSTELENYFMWYTSGWRFGEVIAWQPLPERYKAESEN